MEILKHEQIVGGLRELGVHPGDKVLVHASLVAFGQVEGGADAVIDALLEAVGAQGMVVVPTFACKPPFDRKISTTQLGAVPDKLWRRTGAVRSMHPTHSVAAIGPGSEELIRDHEKAPTAYGLGTPYCKLADMGGKVLLLGVDQDRNTSLHSGEALAGAPYLTDIQGTYVDDSGKKVTIAVAAMAGPHRNFIGLDRVFGETGIMRVGRIGTAVCRLIDAKAMIDTTAEAIRKNPAAVLCDNPACADCVMQKGLIKASRLRSEDFTLSAVASDISGKLSEVLEATKAEGISALELTAAQYSRWAKKLKAAGVQIVGIRGKAGDTEATRASKESGAPLIVCVSTLKEAEAAIKASGQTNVLLENTPPMGAALYEDLYAHHKKCPPLCFNPAGFAAAGQKPFLGVFYHGTLRSVMRRLSISDGTFQGEARLAGQGNAEVKEIISMLRCRGFSGVMTLRSPEPGVAAFRKAAEAFWNLLETM